MGDLATLLPYAFNIREESTVVKAIRDEEVATSTKRGDVYMTFPCAGGLVGILSRDIVLLKRSDKDVKGCTAKHCPRDWPEEGRPVFIASQFRLQEEGAEMNRREFSSELC